MFQRSFFCHCYLTHFYIILLSLPRSSLFSLYLLWAFSSSVTADLHIILSHSVDRWFERRGRSANSFNEQHRLLETNILHYCKCMIIRIEMDAMFSSDDIGQTLEIHEMLPTTCTAAFSASVCLRGRTIGKERNKMLLKSYWWLLSPCLYLCCVNLRQQNPIHGAVSLFHSCLTTYAHTQRKCKWRCIAWGFWHLNIQNCVWGDNTVTERECCALIEYSHLLDYW